MFIAGEFYYRFKNLAGLQTYQVLFETWLRLRRRGTATRSAGSACIDVRSSYLDICQIEPDIEVGGVAIGRVASQVEQKLIASPVENIIVCISSIALSLAGIGFQCLELVGEVIFKEELRGDRKKCRNIGDIVKICLASFGEKV